jgi:hypothetical protein
LPDEIVMCDSHVERGHCALHRLLWEHSDNDRREHRTKLAEDILNISNRISAMVPKWVFVLTIAGAFSFTVLLFGMSMNTIKNTQDSINKGQDGIDFTLKRIHQRISENDDAREKSKDALKKEMEDVRLSVNTMSGRLSNIETRINEIRQPTNRKEVTP